MMVGRYAAVLSLIVLTAFNVANTMTVRSEECVRNTCGLNGYSYYWCYTANSWNYCCSPSHTCGYYGERNAWCYVDDAHSTQAPCREVTMQIICGW